MRLDVWLWRTRFFKTRSLAAAAIAGDGLRIERNGHVRRVTKPSAVIAPGDLLSFGLPNRMILLRIRTLPERRGPAAEAVSSYEMLTTSPRSDVRDPASEAEKAAAGAAPS